MRLLGLSAFYHDSAAALIEDGDIVAAAQEERFTRKKHDPGFPAHAIRYCLDAAGTDLDDVDNVVFYDKPLIKFERLLETYLANAPRGFRSFRWQCRCGSRRSCSRSGTGEGAGGVRLDWPARGEAPIRRAPPEPRGLRLLRLALRGSGGADASTASASGRPHQSAIGRGNRLEVKREIRLPHTLGLLYSAFTYYTGFKVNSGEYKLMGLAPYGEPKYADLDSRKR